MKRICHYCKQPGEEKGPRELRPYGPNGTDVCAECVLGPNAGPRANTAAKRGAKSKRRDASKAVLADRQRVARAALHRQLLPTEPLILDSQVGPRPLKRRKA